MTEPTPKGPKVHKEPPHGAETLEVENIAEGLEVCKEPPQIDHSTT